MTAQPDSGSEKTVTLERLRRNRLDARLSELLKQHEYMTACNRPGASQALTHAKSSLDETKNALDGDQLQKAWRHVHQAYRFLLMGMEEDELEARRAALRREAEEKLHNWRKEAVLDIVGRDRGGEPISAEKLAHAQSLLDEHFGNVYFKLEAAAIAMRWLPWVLISLLLVILGLAGIASLFPSHAPDFFLADIGIVAVVAVAGSVGATLSNTLSMIGRTSRIPAYLGEVRDWAVRLPLGALSALALVTVIQGDILPFTSMTTPDIYGWAVAAGFSDQLLNRVILKMEKRAEK